MSTPEDAWRKADFYYSCLCNSLVLFAASPSYLDSLTGPVFDPIFELESDYDYAFEYPVFDGNFTSGRVSEELRQELLVFKGKADLIPPELWTWDHLISNETWHAIRIAAEELLTKMGESRRTYDFGFDVRIPGR